HLSVLRPDLVPARHQRAAGQLHDRTNSMGGVRRDRGHSGNCAVVSGQPARAHRQALAHSGRRQTCAACITSLASLRLIGILLDARYRHPREPPGGRTPSSVYRFPLWIKVAGSLLAVALSCQSFFDALLLARLQVERMPLDLFDDVLLKDLALEALERALQTLAFMNLNFSQ